MSDQFDNGSYFKTITDESEDGSANKANSFTKSSYPQLSSRYNFVTPNLKALDLKKDLQQPKVNTIQTEKKPINPTALSVFRRKRSQENLLITESRDNFQNTSTSVSNNISQQLNRNNVQMSKSQSNIFAQMSPKQQMLFTSYLNNANINSHQQYSKIQYGQFHDFQVELDLLVKYHDKLEQNINARYFKNEQLISIKCWIWEQDYNGKQYEQKQSNQFQ